MNNHQVLVGTSTGQLIIVDINSDKLEQEHGDYSRKIKVLDSVAKIFFNKPRTLCIVTEENTDKFALINVTDFEHISTEVLNKDQFFINSVAFNPFFEMTNVDLKDYVKRKLDNYPKEVKQKLMCSRQHV